MSLVIKKINKKFYQFLNKNLNGKTNNINFYLDNVLLPFGLEEYKGKYLINFELTENNNKEFLNYINNLEENILKNLFKKRTLKKLIKENKVCKGNIKKNKNKIITKLSINNQDMSIFQLKNKKNILAKLKIEISGLWVYENNYGIFININEIII